MSAPDTTVVLGGITFTASEVPEKITWGGEQSLKIHKLVGGARVIDAMGRDDRPLEWSGIFVGPNAKTRAKYLDGLRIAGNQVLLTWADFRYLVVVKSFEGDYQRFYQVPYRIGCEVVQDQSQPVNSVSSVSLDDAVNGDVTTGSGLVAGLGVPSLTAAYTTLQTATAAVSSFAKASQAQIQSVLQPLAAVRTQAQALIASTGNTLANIATIGGVLPGNTIAQQVGKLNSAVAASSQQADLVQLDNVMGRVQINLQSRDANSPTISMAGGNLYRVAADEYGDASQWSKIAEANGITDPQLTGINKLVIPANV